jgi:hypothetical protein
VGFVEPVALNVNPEGGVVRAPGAAVKPKLTVPPAGMFLFQAIVEASITAAPPD